MLLYENIAVISLDHALRTLRTRYAIKEGGDSLYSESGEYILGPLDLALVKSTCQTSVSRSEFLKRVYVSVDLTAPLYWWMEFEQYRLDITSLYTSVEDSITYSEFSESDFSFDCFLMCEDEVKAIVSKLNEIRNRFIGTIKGEYMRQLLQLLPLSYNQVRTVTFDYETLSRIYRPLRWRGAREWETLGMMIEKLPYFKEFCIESYESCIADMKAALHVP